MKYKFKKKITKVLAISMALSMILCNNTFATPIDLANSTESVATDTLNKTEGTDYFNDEDTNVWANGQITERVDVTVQRGSEFTVTIPKDIVLDGETGTADYIVNAKGDIAGDQVLKVVPDGEFTMNETGGKDSVIATVIQNDTEYTYQKMLDEGTDYPGSVAATLTAGIWEGSFNFNINFEGGESNSDDSSNSDTLPEVKATLNDYTWEEISAISASGEAETTYGLKVKDTKEITLTNGETYNAQIIGFEHDNLADGSGKAGITFQFKEVMNTTKAMNTSNTNVDGWKASEMREYLNNEEDINSVYNLLPSDLQAEIKEVNKVSDIGNFNTTDTITTVDKLFLLSLGEFGNTSGVAGQGTKYEFYFDENNQFTRIKYINGSAAGWWLRSTVANNPVGFYSIHSSGVFYINNSNELLGVAPAFCI